MRAGFGQFNTPTPEFLRFAAQYGVKDVLLAQPQIPDAGGKWAVSDLVKMRIQVENEGLRLMAIENVPLTFYQEIIVGGPNRERQIENMVETIRNIGAAGIPIFGYHWMPSHVWRSQPAIIRGGALATAFDNAEAQKMPNTHGREHTEEEMWERLEEWIRIITPIAEEAGVRCGIHPCDPPVEKLGGIPMLFRSFDAYKRLIEIVDSPSNGIEFCQGTFSEMEDAANGGIYDMIRYFGERKKILYVHFRNVSGTVPKFHEEFINTGHVDMYKAMKIYHEVGYDSFFIDDHVPQTFEDTPWGHRGRAFANGYIQAMIEAVTKQSMG